MTKWADPTTARGRIETIIETILSGGASDRNVNDAVDKILSLNKRPFNAGDGGSYYLIKGSLRDEFEILAQRRTKEELDTFVETTCLGTEKIQLTVLRYVEGQGWSPN